MLEITDGASSCFYSLKNFATIRVNKSNKIYETGWENCRERFHKKLRKRTRYLYCLDYPLTNISSLLKVIQDKLRLSSDQRVIISETNKPGIIHVGLSEFWTNTLASRLLTIMLRDAKHYRGDLDEWLNCRETTYVKHISYPIKRYLDGYMVLTKRIFPGWIKCFVGKDKSQIDNLLIGG